MGLLAPDSAEIPRASVIVPHLNSPEALVRLLQSLAGQRLDSGGFEILVVDNGSRMPLDAVKAAWPEVRFLEEREPGPGPARNFGIRHARADRFGFIDADMRAGPGWLAAGLAALDRAASGHVGGDVRIDAADPERMTGAEAFEAVFSYRMDRYIAREGFTGTGNLFITRELFELAGPFGGLDTAEDKQFGLRASAAGRPPVFAPDAIAFHPARRDLADMRAKWQRLSVQALTARLAEGQPLWQWDLRALAVILSAVPHSATLLASPRIAGIGNRLRGVLFLYRIRWVRAMDMLGLSRAVRRGQRVSAAGWNA